MANPLGIIAGQGALPIELAKQQQAAGRTVFIAALQNFADVGVENFPHHYVGLGQVHRIVELMRQAGCQELVLLGAVQRPDFAKIKLDKGGLWVVEKLLQKSAAGDNQVLENIIDYFRQHDFKVLGADVFLADFFAPKGLQSKMSHQAHKADMARAIEVTRAIGALDIGQGAVVCRKLVLAVEGVEGTDNMLARVAQLPQVFIGSDAARAGVFAKLPKPNQDRRVDLPTIGVKTIQQVAAAGLAGMVYEAGGALFIDGDAIRAAADKHGLFLFGTEADGQ